ncbi:hypothetical protein ACFL49_00025 [Candidatus Omnitrophota bacterium]
MIEIIIPCGIIVLSFIYGLFLFCKPQKMIDLQIAFYRPLNWDIKPISMEKEIRNTRIMGVGLLLFTVGAAVFFFLK